MRYDLNNKTIIITGATSGIGRSLVTLFASKKARLCLLGRNQDKLNALATEFSNQTEDIFTLRVDLSKQDDLFRASQKIINNYNSIDILLHCAAVIKLCRLSKCTPGEFDLQYRTNLRGPFLLTKLFVPHFTKNSAQIVYINSSAGVNPGLENGLYSATKHGLKALADSFRKELNKSGIRVISIYPGRTATPMQKEIYSYENREYLPKRLLQPEDIAIAVENALCMPKTAEITDLFIRPFYKTD